VSEPSRDMLNLLSDEEIAMCLAVDPGWALPNYARDTRLRMARARAINAVAGSELAHGDGRHVGRRATANAIRALWETQNINTTDAAEVSRELCPRPPPCAQMPAIV